MRLNFKTDYMVFCPFRLSGRHLHIKYWNCSLVDISVEISRLKYLVNKNVWNPTCKCIAM